MKEREIMSTAELMVSKKITCSECGCADLVKCREKGEIICMECGLVITGATTKDQESDYSRKILPTSISENVPEKETILHSQMPERWREMFRPSDQTEENLAFGLSEITRIACELSLSKTVLETASRSYKVIVENRLTKGRSIRAFCATAVYTACRQCGSARTLDEVAKASRTERKEVAHCYRILIENSDCAIPLANPRQHVSRFLEQLAIEGKTVELVYKIMKSVEDGKFTAGKNPVGIISAAIYMAGRLAGEKRTQREISEVTRVTETSIRNRYKDLEKHLDLMIAL